MSCADGVFGVSSSPAPSAFPPPGRGSGNVKPGFLETLAGIGAGFAAIVLPGVVQVPLPRCSSVFCVTRGKYGAPPRSPQDL